MIDQHFLSRLRVFGCLIFKLESFLIACLITSVVTLSMLMNWQVSVARYLNTVMFNTQNNFTKTICKNDPSCVWQDAVWQKPTPELFIEAKSR